MILTQGEWRRQRRSKNRRHGCREIDAEHAAGASVFDDIHGVADQFGVDGVGETDGNLGDRRRVAIAVPRQLQQTQILAGVSERTDQVVVTTIPSQHEAGALEFAT